MSKEMTGRRLQDAQETSRLMREFVAVSTEERLPEEFVRQLAGAPDDANLLFDDTLTKKSTTMV